MASSEAATPLYVAAAPHTHTRRTVPKVMLQVTIALVPALLWSVYVFGVGALMVTALAVTSCMVFDELSRRVLGNEGSWRDGSAAVTGLLLALNLPASAPWWLVLVGSFVAVVVAKQLFGGLGHNPFNPAIVARVVLLIAFPKHLSTWPVAEAVWNPAAVDAITAATPLGMLKTDGHKGVLALPWSDLLLGRSGGSLGETSAVALLLGGVYLFVRRIIRWHTPVAFVGTVAVIAALHWVLGGEIALPPHYHVLTGGLLLGAFFMATDYVTSPITAKGQLIFGVGCGVITMVIRIFGAYPEGVSFAILLMNGFVPLIERYSRPKRFGSQEVSRG